MAQKTRSRKAPKASRPYAPGYGIKGPKEGSGLLPWSWAVERLRKGHNYWIATTRPDGRPHAMPVWGLWLDDAIYFSTGRQSRKAQNLAANPNCVVCPEGARQAVVVEGRAAEVKDSATLKRFAAAYQKKYHWDMSDFKEPVFVVRPRVVFGMKERDFFGSATRWAFEKP